MPTLTHYRLCPRSRSIRLAAGELNVAVQLVEQEPWAIGPPFLALNPAGELPVLNIENGPMLCGAYAAAEYLCCDFKTADQTGPPPLMLFPTDGEDRAEVRRLIDWCHQKLDRDVTRELLHEKVYARGSGQQATSPNADILRVARANLRYHLSYFDYLTHERTWLAGDSLSFADLACAAHLSVLDYLGEITWTERAGLKAWYQKVKSRPAFRPLLEDRVAGMAPPQHYDDLDF